MLTRLSSVFQVISCNWKHLINRKVQVKKVFWCYIVICATLCVCFSSKLKATNVFPKLWKLFVFLNENYRKHVFIQFKFCRVIVKYYFCNVSYKFLIKIENRWRCEIKEHTPQLTLLYCGITVTRSHWSCYIKKAILKTFAIFTAKASVLGSIFSKKTFSTF